MFFDDPLVEIVAAIGVVSFFTFAQLATRPFNQRVLNQLEACGLMVTFCVQLASILYWRVDSSAGASGRIDEAIITGPAASSGLGAPPAPGGVGGASPAKKMCNTVAFVKQMFFGVR